MVAAQSHILCCQADRRPEHQMINWSLMLNIVDAHDNSGVDNDHNREDAIAGDDQCDVDENNVGVGTDIDENNIDIDIDIDIDVNIDIDENNIDVDTLRNPPLVRCEAVIGQAALRMNYTALSFSLLNKKIHLHYID